MNSGLTRVMGGVEEHLCWCFRVHGKDELSYEPSDGQLGPFDRDRQRRLKRGETFQRLDRSGSPRCYQGLFWRPKAVAASVAP